LRHGAEQRVSTNNVAVIVPASTDLPAGDAEQGQNGAHDENDYAERP
jgi:hypothetical protein